MKHLSAVLLLLSVCFGLQAQTEVLDLIGLEPAEDYENIHVQKIGTDDHSTSFVIWVKDEVKPHFPADHTETLYVLSGTGIMILNDEGVRVGAGNMVVIPPNTIHSVEVTSDIPLKVLSVQAPEFHGKDRHFTEGE